MPIPDAPRVVVTTSWDDADPADTRIAELLHANALSGTFYVPMVGYNGRPILTTHQLRELADAGFEIGAHGLSHKTLLQLPPAQLRIEVADCKNILEQRIGTQISMFCYPNGQYDSRVLREVRLAGYQGARTCRMLSLRFAGNPFELETTIQAFPHSGSAYLRNLAKARNVSGLLRYAIQLRRIDGWLQMGKRLFDKVLLTGGVWHLYGHSWEIRDFGLWSQLRELLSYVSRRKNVSYMPNVQLITTRSADTCVVAPHPRFLQH